MAANLTSRLAERPIGSPVDLMTDFETYRPGIDDLWQQFKNNFSLKHAPKSQHPRELNVSLMLSPHDAMLGGHYSIDVPVGHVCDRCDGSGSTGVFECDLCSGHGMSWQTARVIVFIPQQVRDATVIPISLRHLGVNNLFLNVHVRVAN